MAQRNVAQDGRAEGPNHSRATGQGQKRRKASVSSPCRHDRRTGRSVATKRLLADMRAIADTGFLVAFANRNDHHHAWAVEVAARVTDPLLTCEAVLAETAFHLGSSSIALAFVRDGLVRPALVLGEHLPRLAELAARYADQRPDLADLCLIRLSELHSTF